MAFNPVGNEQIILEGRIYRVRSLSDEGILATKALRILGGRAQVYQLIDIDNEQTFALKVMLPAFRAPQLLRHRDLLAQLAVVPGFDACRQTYFTPQTHSDDLKRYPDLAYASLMPWIEGATWTTIVGDPDSVIGPSTSWEIAYQLVRLVRVLERHGIAHCDLSGGNIMVDLKTCRVTLIDLDEIYWPGAPPPLIVPTGTPGYRRQPISQWHSNGDRFATAILIAEMLGWRDERVRASSSGDTYFVDADYDGQDMERYHLLDNFLRELHPDLAKLFERTWRATTADAQPLVDEWRTAIIIARGWRSMPLDPLERVRIDLSRLPAESPANISTGAVAASTAILTQLPASGPGLHEVALPGQGIKAVDIALLRTPSIDTGTVIAVPMLRTSRVTVSNATALPDPAPFSPIQLNQRGRRLFGIRLWLIALIVALAIGLTIVALILLRTAQQTTQVESDPVTSHVVISPMNATEVKPLANWTTDPITALLPFTQVQEVVVGTATGNVDIWQLAPAKLLKSLATQSGPIHDMTLSRDGTLLATATLERTLRLWSVADGTLVRALSATSVVNVMAFDPATVGILATGMLDGSVQLWRVDDGALLRVLRGHSDQVWAVAFSADGRMLASGSRDGTVRIWQVSDGLELRVLGDGQSAINSVAFSPNQETIAAGAYDRAVHLWRVSDGAELWVTRGHTRQVNSVAFSPDGEIVASVSEDTLVQLLDASHGNPLRVLPGHSDTVRDVVFSPDGGILVSGGDDGILRIWAVP